MPGTIGELIAAAGLADVDLFEIETGAGEPTSRKLSAGLLAEYIADALAGRLLSEDGSASINTADLVDQAVTAAKLSLGAWSDVASAATVGLAAEASRNLRITGTTAITSFGPGAVDGVPYRLRFAASLTLTHGANLVLPGAANIATAAGDVAVVVHDGADVWRVISYHRAANAPVVIGNAQGQIPVLGAGGVFDSARIPVVGGQVVHVREVMASGASPATATAGTWTTRAINTVERNDLSGSGASLAGSVLTLPAGSYIIDAIAPFYLSRHSALRLYNVTAGAVLFQGAAFWAYGSETSNGGQHVMKCKVTLAASTQIRLEHLVQRTVAQNFGAALSLGGSEYYAELFAERVG